MCCMIPQMVTLPSLSHRASTSSSSARSMYLSTSTGLSGSTSTAFSMYRFRSVSLQFHTKRSQDWSCVIIHNIPVTSVTAELCNHSQDSDCICNLLCSVSESHRRCTKQSSICRETLSQVETVIFIVTLLSKNKNACAPYLTASREHALCIAVSNAQVKAVLHTFSDSITS